MWLDYLYNSLTSLFLVEWRNLLCVCVYIYPVDMCRSLCRGKIWDDVMPGNLLNINNILAIKKKICSEKSDWIFIVGIQLVFPFLSCLVIQFYLTLPFYQFASVPFKHKYSTDSDILNIDALWDLRNFVFSHLFWEKK